MQQCLPEGWKTVIRSHGFCLYNLLSLQSSQSRGSSSTWAGHMPWHHQNKSNWGARWAESIFYHYTDKLRTLLDGGSTGQASSSTVYNNDSSSSSHSSSGEHLRREIQSHAAPGQMQRHRHKPGTAQEGWSHHVCPACPAMQPDLPLWLWCPPSTRDCHRVTTGRFGSWCAPFHLPEWLPRKTAA